MAKKYGIFLRLSDSEKKKLEQDATMAGLSKTDLLRSLIMGLTIKPRPPAELRELYIAINRIGVNINQIARKVNAGIASKNDMQELLFLMRKVDSRMARIADD